MPCKGRGLNLTYVARRNLGAICVSMLLVTATSAQTRDDRDPRGIPQQNDATREGTEAAATQTSATPATTSRFQRERIENDERTSDDVRATNRGNDASEEESEIIRRRAIEARRLQPMSEFETFVSEVVDKPLRRFGSNLLVPTARDFTAPPSTTVPPEGGVPAQLTPTAVNAEVTLATVKPRSAAAVCTPQAPWLKLVLAVQYRSFARANTWNAVCVFQPAVVAKVWNALLYTPDE